MARIITIVLVLMLLSACAQPSCDAQDPTYTAAIVGFVGAWQQTATAAEATAADALGPQIAELEVLRTQVQALTPPGCGRNAKSALVVAITAAIDELTARLEQQSPEQIKARHASVVLATERLNDELDNLRIRPTAVPNPIPPLNSNIDAR